MELWVDQTGGMEFLKALYLCRELPGGIQRYCSTLALEQLFLAEELGKLRQRRGLRGATATAFGIRIRQLSFPGGSAVPNVLLTFQNNQSTHSFPQVPA